MIICVFIIGVSYVCIVNSSFIHNDSQNDAMKDQSIPKKDDKTNDISNGTSKPNVNTSIQDDQDIHPTEKKNPNKKLSDWMFLKVYRKITISVFQLVYKWFCDIII